MNAITSFLHREKRQLRWWQDEKRESERPGAGQAGVSVRRSSTSHYQIRLYGSTVLRFYGSTSLFLQGLVLSEPIERADVFRLKNTILWDHERKIFEFGPGDFDEALLIFAGCAWPKRNHRERSIEIA